MLNEIDLSRVDLNLLVLFDTVREAGHVGRAAEQLHLSASAVSHGLGRLRRLLNDPLFIRNPKGVVPTERAMQLAGPIADVLARARSVLASAEPFDPARSTRRFTIGAPDGISAVLLPRLLDQLRDRAPGVDIGVRQLMPAPGEYAPERAWRSAFTDLETRAMDIAVLPFGEVPPRFHAGSLYEEDFVVVVATGHPFARSVTLDRFCEMRHLVVSGSGDAHGFVDQVLAEHGRERRIALTVPNFMFALSIVAETDLVCALPRRFAAMHAARFGIVNLEAPLPMGRFQLHAVTPKAALMDAGLKWLFELLCTCAKRRHARRKP
ncbi:MAG: LysR family transcriptional regulator [Rhizobacter sp.]|nr:LysR family transcriptional regulator [Rhizobacter sp.]